MSSQITQKNCVIATIHICWQKFGKILERFYPRKVILRNHWLHGFTFLDLWPLGIFWILLEHYGTFCIHWPLGTFWIPWNTRYLLDTLDHFFGYLGPQGICPNQWVPFVYIGPLEYICKPWSIAFWIPWTTRHLLDTLNHLVPIEYLEPLGTIWIPWTTRYLLYTLDLKLLLGTLNHYIPFGYLEPLGTCWIPWTSVYHMPTLDHKVPLAYLGPLSSHCSLGPLGTLWIP